MVSCYLEVLNHTQFLFTSSYIVVYWGYLNMVFGLLLLLPLALMSKAAPEFHSESSSECQELMEPCCLGSEFPGTCCPGTYCLGTCCFPFEWMGYSTPWPEEWYCQVKPELSSLHTPHVIVGTR